MRLRLVCKWNDNNNNNCYNNNNNNNDNNNLNSTRIWMVINCQAGRQNCTECIIELSV